MLSLILIYDLCKGIQQSILYYIHMHLYCICKVVFFYWKNSNMQFDTDRMTPRVLITLIQ